MKKKKRRHEWEINREYRDEIERREYKGRLWKRVTREILWANNGDSATLNSKSGDSKQHLPVFKHTHKLTNTHTNTRPILQNHPTHKKRGLERWGCKGKRRELFLKNWSIPHIWNKKEADKNILLNIYYNFEKKKQILAMD